MAVRLKQKIDTSMLTHACGITWQDISVINTKVPRFQRRQAGGNLLRTIVVFANVSTTTSDQGSNSYVVM